MSVVIKLKALSLIKSILPNFKASDGRLKSFIYKLLHNLVFWAKTSMGQDPQWLKNYLKISEFRR